MAIPRLNIANKGYFKKKYIFSKLVFGTKDFMQTVAEPKDLA